MTNQTAIIPFTFEAFTVRTQMIDGEPWFVAADVGRALGIANIRDNLRSMREEWKRVGETDTSTGSKEVTIICEAAVYKLAFRSNKPKAEAFADWVASEVLPTIRKTGSYSVQRANFSELERLANLTVSAIENKVSELRVEFKSDLQVLKESLPIDGAQAKAIHKSVRVLAGRMGGQPVHYRRAWRALYDRFEVAAHRDIPQNRYDEALEFIGGLTQAYSEPKGQRSLWEDGNE